MNGKAAQRVASGHPWIFESDVTDRGEARGGDTVCVAAPGGRALGMALYSAKSKITLRMISSRVEPVDRVFLLRRMQNALDLRRGMVLDCDAYRVIYGEADLLPGLVVDRYADCLVLQALNQSIDRLTPLIVDALTELLSPTAIIARNDVAVRTQEDLPLESKILHGVLPNDLTITMNGLQLRADLLGGQKTGIYLDQRENYSAASRYAKGRVLDCFTSTGGFALHMASKCDTVEAIDSSANALAVAQANAQRNQLGNIQFLEANAFDLLAGHAAARRSFDVIVLDPPAFTKSRSAVEAAMRGYKEINLRALQLLQPGGVLISCSCSHHVSEAMMLEAIAGASLDTGRQLRVLERRTQSQDHPILLTVPETHYLKCIILQVL